MRIDTALFSRNRGRGPGRLHRALERGGQREEGERRGEAGRDGERRREKRGERGRQTGRQERDGQKGRRCREKGWAGDRKRKREREGKATETKKRKERDWEGTSPVVQGLRLRDPTAGRQGVPAGFLVRELRTRRLRGAKGARGGEREMERRETWEDKAQRDDGVERKRRTEV